jgi:hypothetical protein
MSPTNPHWARLVGNGPFSLCVIHKEGLCPSSGDINRLMMMSNVFIKFVNSCSDKMRSFVLLVVLALAASSFAEGDTYTNRFDDVNVDEIIANRRLLVPYLKCILDKGRCTAEGKELKGIYLYYL